MFPSGEPNVGAVAKAELGCDATSLEPVRGAGGGEYSGAPRWLNVGDSEVGRLACCAVWLRSRLCGSTLP